MATMPPPHMLAQLLQGMGRGGPPGAGGPPGMGAAPPPDLGGIQKMASAPPGQEGPLFNQAKDAIGTLMQRYALRSPKLAKELATALVHLKAAEEQSATLPAEPVAAPPPGMPSGGGMMGGGDIGSPSMPQLGG